MMNMQNLPNISAVLRHIDNYVGGARIIIAFGVTVVLTAMGISLATPDQLSIWQMNTSGKWELISTTPESRTFQYKALLKSASVDVLRGGTFEPEIGWEEAPIGAIYIQRGSESVESGHKFMKMVIDPIMFLWIASIWIVPTFLWMTVLYGITNNFSIDNSRIVGFVCYGIFWGAFGWWPIDFVYNHHDAGQEWDPSKWGPVVIVVTVLLTGLHLYRIFTSTQLEGKIS